VSAGQRDVGEPAAGRHDGAAVRLRYRLAGAAGALTLSSLLGSTRVEPVNAEAYEQFHQRGQPVVFALWHGRLLAPTYRHRHKEIVALASRSGDGEYITRVLHHWGFEVVRGSSSRGGDAALRELIRKVRSGKSVAITADGPRGPREQLKHGVLQIAQITGAPVVAVGSAASRAWRLNSWDRFMVPKPFSKLRVVYGDAVFIPRDLKAAGLPAMAHQLEQIMAQLTLEAEAPFQ
jgi:lysophospholipid acyltransferase (LPLAT)-like uncharacterized protein